ncbi:MAG: YbjN domain-containing protein [Microcystaceae cyanobacterium]
MSSLFDSVIQYFEDDDWKFMEVSPKEALKMGVSGRNGEYDCYAIANEERQTFRFVSQIPIKVPENQRVLMAEFLTRANYGLSVGNFEMDFEDGEIRYKTSIDVEGDRLTPALVENLVNINVITVDRYFPGMMKVIYGGLSPEDAIQSVEEGE